MISQLYWNTFDPWQTQCDEQMNTRGRAAELFNAGNYADAIPLYREIVEVDPADLNAWQCLVMCLRDTESY